MNALFLVQFIALLLAYNKFLDRTLLLEEI